MSIPITELSPKVVWNQFARLNAVPRPSKKEERVIAFMEDFGHSLKLETKTDAIGNVLIRKPASPGKEHLPGVVLQAHLDMVHQKNSNTVFDFETEGIRMRVDGDWVRAEGTTLGADNGLGVAAIMAVLEADDIEHPPIEALFTIDEETGMTGAKKLRTDWLSGSVLLNLDTEEDHVLTVGCAGGIDVTAQAEYTPEAAAEASQGLRIEIRGLQGGHSGMDIHKGLGNANKLMARLLQAVTKDSGCRLAEFRGGNLRNAIPRESEAIVALDPAQLEVFMSAFEQERKDITEEFALVETGLQITAEACPAPQNLLPVSESSKLLDVLRALYNGVYFMSYAFPELTETSNNLARVLADDGQIEIGCLTRSSRESRKQDLVRTLKAIFNFAGYQVQTGGDYPGWEPDTESPTLALLQERYRALFSEEPTVEAGHGGLECGIIKSHYPEMDMISFGPTILGAHSPDERASISSTQKFWHFLKDILAQIGT